MFGVYISVPFCRTKCSFCNFASGVVSKAAFACYVDRVVTDINAAETLAARVGANFEREVDSIYLGGGTPTVLEDEQLVRLVDAVRGRFRVRADSEVTVEVAPGTLSNCMLETLVRCGVNRVSLGVQSFVDEEARSVGRLHTREITVADVERLRSAGIANISVDLIAGLPHQTRESWDYSLQQTIDSGVPHVSVYMLEVDEDSRLGRELIAGGTKYHAHFVPDEDTTADLYERACERLSGAGIAQYEISNFARSGCESKHNLKYWTRAPYLGFGVDAHSMLRADGTDAGLESVRTAAPETLEEYVAGEKSQVTKIDRVMAHEEEFFLGLRMMRGIDASKVENSAAGGVIADLTANGLVDVREGRIRLTRRGLLLSNEVFQRFLGAFSG